MPVYRVPESFGTWLRVIEVFAHFRYTTPGCVVKKVAAIGAFNPGQRNARGPSVSLSGSRVLAMAEP
ncbi:hypothetical protein D3C86_1947440 [compost metagenome]